MGNITVAIKRFLGNKNTVTIIGVIAGIAVLYFGYNWRVNQAIEPQKVPYAKVAIDGNTLITQDMIGTVEVSKNMINTAPNLVTSSGSVLGKYVRWDTTVAEGSLFYKTQLATEEELPNSVLKNIPDGYTLYRLGVNMQSTFANSIMPGNYIDLYYKFTDDDNYIVFGKFIESIEVLAVKDAQGQHVFSSTSQGIPAELLFAVPNDYFQLLKKSDYIKTNNVEIVPVPRNKDYSENPTATQITSEAIKAFINAKAVNAEQNVGNNPITPNTNNPTE